MALGSMVPSCLGVADKLNGAGFGVTVVDSRWVKPIDPALIDLARRHAMVVASRTTDAWAGLTRH